jgi:HK97 family phage portal protein
MKRWWIRAGAGRSVSEHIQGPVSEAKASRVAGAVPGYTAYYEGLVPYWSKRSATSLIREGFLSNPVVYRAVRAIVDNASAMSLILMKGREEMSEHPLLALLKRPNPMASGKSMMECLYTHLLLAGNAYVEVVTLDGLPQELYALRPDRMSVMPGKDGWPQGFQYKAGDQTITIRADQDTGLIPVLHLKQYHPLNDHYGLSPLEAAHKALDIHNSACGWNKALLDNSARPSGALVYGAKEGRAMSDDQFERLKEELEVNFQGFGNAGRPLLLEGGLDWKAMSFSPRDMDFMQAKHSAARDIALAFGVPPMLLGIPGDNTYANYAEANRALWRQTILPLVERTLEDIGQWLMAFYGEDDLVLTFDMDQISALSSEREALWRRIQAADFLSDDEKRAAVGYGPKVEV